MRSVKCHYTAGYNSDDLIRNQGLAQWLITRGGQIIQYAEADALCWDSGEWNDDGPGIEIEAAPQYGQTIFTVASRDSTRALCRWLHDEWGMPLDYHDGPRLPEGSWLGFISHRSLQQSQPHSDYWPAEDAAFIFGEDDMGWALSDYAWVKNHVTGLGIDGQTEITNRMVLDAVAALAQKVDEIPPAAVVSGSSLTPDAVRAIVREELNKTKLAG
jgi:hypothetical protein